jgi:cytidylate kinase
MASLCAPAKGTADSVPSSPPETTEQPLIIAIDGPAGAGKSTIARMLASRLGIPYLDTGAMYRAVALLALREGLETPLGPDDADTVLDVVERHRIRVEPRPDGSGVFVDDEEVTAEIRSTECAMMASAVSALSELRARLVAAQRELGLVSGGVMEGRDITSVVFPDARLKVFLTAAPEERARRRHGDLKERDQEASLEEVRRQQRQRDRQDTSRADSPLQVARGAIVIDTTRMTPEEVVSRLLQELERTPGQALDSNDRNNVRSPNHVS